MRYHILYITLFSKIRNMALTKTKRDVRDEILEWLRADDRDLMWLHRKTKIPYGTIYSCFKQRYFQLSEENLIKINQATGEEFTH